jgi:hypothetical protein
MRKLAENKIENLVDELEPKNMDNHDCGRCEEKTMHNVYIELVEESGNGFDDGTKFSREPYRIAECVECADLSYDRANNF